jgi:hypothetical protein
MKFPWLPAALLLAAAATAQGQTQEVSGPVPRTSPGEFRLGILGTDTSHVPTLTHLFNDADAPGHVPGFRVVAAYKGGSPDLDISLNRVDKFAAELQAKWGVEIVPDIAALCRKTDGILLESVDGRPHLEQARQVIAARRPMFIDKPFAATLEDAREIARLARQAGVPWFSTSDERYNAIVATMKVPDMQGVEIWGPGPIIPGAFPLELAWYGIHEIEMLYAMMGAGCDQVIWIYGSTADAVAGRWKDGRIGSVRLLRPYGPIGAVVYGPKQILQSAPNMKGGYAGLGSEIAKFFHTGVPPVPNEETLELFAFLDAAQRSKAAGGAPMKLR